MSKNYKSFSMELAGRTLTVDIGRVAAQANGAAFMRSFSVRIYGINRNFYRIRIFG